MDQLAVESMPMVKYAGDWLENLTRQTPHTDHPVQTLEAACRSSGTLILDLHLPFTPPSEAFRANPEAAEAAHIIAAAALQLETIVTPPQVSLSHIVHLKSSALRICLESGVTEILCEAGSQGIHVKDIGKKNGQDPERLGCFMHYLATHHVHRQVSLNVFAHTRISSMLDTLKPSTKVITDLENKHNGTTGLAALVSHHLDETFKASAYAWETLSDPATRFSGNPAAASLAHVIGSADMLWTYYARLEECFRHDRFGIGMEGIQALQPPDAILKAYDWGQLAAGSLIVDVASGVGTLCLTLAEKFPELKFVVQDLEVLFSRGKRSLWNKKMPAVMSSGQVKFQVHDFFTPQCQTGATVFMILTHLSVATAPETTLLLFETILPLAIHNPNAKEEGLLEAPSPLLVNYGGANDMGYNVDFVMFLLFNAQERTQMQFVELLACTGWDTFIQCIEAKKVAP
ncbi:S-adenosyl-L-methionine-dependent methyltransferase [Mycena albidolilacea]|uniref:S-adenosyl-L-methionine-dependent methyltransferase n=1 Tax=Mycena albidolilacea TaxID=1033008 RepID=A0AAD7EVZ7_9AGAR|nr:S-adenosyl-L-methionine-dependent methyltransferase [Mycena albidolilacea]